MVERTDANLEAANLAGLRRGATANDREHLDGHDARQRRRTGLKQARVGAERSADPTGLIRLQRTAGNAAVNSLLSDQTLVQRAPAVDAPLAPQHIDLFPPGTLGGVAGRDSPSRAIQVWLDANRATVAVTPLRGLQRAVREQVPAASSLPTDEVRAVIIAWASAQHMPVHDDGSSEQERVPDSALKGLAMGAMPQASGADVDHDEEGLTEISVFGATVGAGTEEAGLGASATWDGTFGVFASYGRVRLTGEVSVTGDGKPKSWKIQLSFPGDASIPELPSLTNVFTEANKAISDSAGIAATANGPAQAAARIRPQLGPLREAVESLSAIAKGAPISFGISAERTEPDGGEGPAVNQGPTFEIKATLTILF